MATSQISGGHNGLYSVFKYFPASHKSDLYDMNFSIFLAEECWTLIIVQIKCCESRSAVRKASARKQPRNFSLTLHTARGKTNSKV